MESLEDLLYDSSKRHEAFDLIRSLIEEVRLTPEDGELTIELSGDPAGILAISDANKLGTPPAQRALQIEMVAGVGFEPTTFRL